MRYQVAIMTMALLVLFSLGTLWGAYSPGGIRDEPVAAGVRGTLEPQAGSWPERLLEHLTPYLGFLALPALVAAFMGTMAALAMAGMSLASLFLGRRREAPVGRCPACRASVSSRSRTCPRCHTRLSPSSRGEYLEDAETRVWRGPSE